MRRATLLIAVLVLTPLTTVTAQEAAAAPGTRIRVSAQGLAAPRLVGTVVALHADTLLFAPQSGRGLIAVPRESIERLEVSRSRSSVGPAILKYAGIGLFMGAATGALAGPLVMSSGCTALKKDVGNQSKCLADLVDGETRLKAALLFGIAGTAVGALVGAIVGRERWERVVPGGVRVSFAPQPTARFTLVASVGF